MLTLRQALKLPCFEKGCVVAGGRGLDQVVQRVHVVDIPDAKYAWGRGALLLTAGYGLKDSSERQAALIPTLVRQGLVGMVFSLGLYFQSVPEAILRAADENNFPVIQVPLEVQFVEITERLYIEIVNHQFALKERAADIQCQLTRLVLEGGDLAAVARTLANFLERSVLIESPNSDVLAAEEFGSADQFYHNSVRASRTPSELRQRLIQRGVYDLVQQQMRHIRIDAMPDLGMSMERVVAPIIVGRKIYGYIWIIAGDHPLIDLDELAIDHGATVAALVLLKEQAVREAQQAARGDLLTLLLRDDSSRDSLMFERARVLGYRLDQPHQVLFVSSGQNGARTLLPVVIHSDLIMWLEKILCRERDRGLVVNREHGTVVIVEAKSQAEGKKIAERIAAEIASPADSFVIGVSHVCPPDQSLKRAYDQALEAAEIGQRLAAPARLICFWELGLLDWVYRLSPDALALNPYLGKIETLAQHDAKTQSGLLQTLEAYLEYGGALAEAATAINVHRNTLQYRLGKIQELVQVDLRDVTQRLNLHVALKAYRLKSS